MNEVMKVWTYIANRYPIIYRVFKRAGFESIKTKSAPLITVILGEMEIRNNRYRNKGHRNVSERCLAKWIRFVVLVWNWCGGMCALNCYHQLHVFDCIWQNVWFMHNAHIAYVAEMALWFHEIGCSLKYHQCEFSCFEFSCVHHRVVDAYVHYRW